MFAVKKFRPFVILAALVPLGTLGLMPAGVSTAQAAAAPIRAVSRGLPPSVLIASLKKAGGVHPAVGASDDFPDLCEDDGYLPSSGSEDGIPFFDVSQSTGEVCLSGLHKCVALSPAVDGIEGVDCSDVVVDPFFDQSTNEEEIGAWPVISAYCQQGSSVVQCANVNEAVELGEALVGTTPVTDFVCGHSNGSCVQNGERNEGFGEGVGLAGACSGGTGDVGGLFEVWSVDLENADVGGQPLVSQIELPSVDEDAELSGNLASGHAIICPSGGI